MSVVGKTRGKIVGGLLQSEAATPGVKAGTNVSIAQESGGDPVHTTIFNLNATPVTLTDQPSTVLYGGQKLYDVPAGCILILGATADLVVTVAGNLDADAQGAFSMGSVTAGNDGTLTGTEADIIPSTAITMTASTGDSNGQSTAVAFLDGTGTDVDIFLNYIWDDADHDGGSQTVTGTITLAWINLGDY